VSKRVVFILILLTVLLYAWPLWQWLQQEKIERDIGGSSFYMVSSSPGRENQTPFIAEEFISPLEDIQVHVASMAELSDGTLAVVWYGGEYEGSTDTLIYFTTCKPGENRQWTQPREIVSRDTVSLELNRYIKKVGNPVIFTDSRNRLWLLYVTVSLGGWSGSSLNAMISNDNGKTWSLSQRLTLSPFFNVSELVRNNPLRLTKGGFIVPIYHEFIGTFSELLWLSSEADGKTFRYYKTRLTCGKRFIQPSMVALAPYAAAVFFRSHRSNSNIAWSLSDDTGRTWTAPQYIDLPNPGAGINALLLSGKRILLAYNDSKYSRERLALAISSVEEPTSSEHTECYSAEWLRYEAERHRKKTKTKKNQTWRRVAVLEDTPGEEFSYPYMVRTHNGKIHLVYTWRRKRIKHLVFNEAWINRRLMMNDE
jgi:predicted neuraminidase